MFRLGIHNTLIKSTRSGLRSPVAPVVLSTKSSCHIAPLDETTAQPKDRKVIPLRNKYSEQTRRLFSTSSFDEKPDPEWVFVGNEWCRVPRLETCINFQDVRGPGPLFQPRVELSADHEKARQQWHELRKAYNLKQGIATALWEKNRELRMRYRAAEALLARREDELTAIYAERDEHVQNNKMLHAELSHVKSTLWTMQKNGLKWREYL